MARALNPLQFVLMAMAGWMNERQQQVIEYLQEENRALREQTGKRRLRFSDVAWQSRLKFWVAKHSPSWTPW
jgi:hypothetical protein